MNADSRLKTRLRFISKLSFQNIAMNSKISFCFPTCFVAGLVFLTMAPTTNAQIISSARVFGSNDPEGNSYSESVMFDSNAEMVSNGTLSVTERIFGIAPNEYYVEMQFESVSGNFVQDIDAFWNTGYEIQYDRDVIYDGDFWTFTSNGDPMDLSGGGVGPHPYDPLLTEVWNGDATRTANDVQTFGIFGSRFTNITNLAGVDANEVDGFILGVRVIVAVPEPSSCSILASLIAIGLLRRKRSGLS
jgi:hypothetical protein